MLERLILQKLAVLVHGLIGTGSALAAAYNASKGNYGKAALYGGIALWEVKAVDEHLEDLANIPGHTSPRIP